MKKPSFTKSVPDIEQVVSSNYTKWVPLLCAGAAAGVSIIALKELKNVRKELVNLKREQTGTNDLNKKMESIEQQLKMLSDFVQNKERVKKESEIIRNVVEESEKEVHIINGEEYEEIEVTDDEDEQTEE